MRVLAQFVVALDIKSFEVLVYRVRRCSREVPRCPSIGAINPEFDSSRVHGPPFRRDIRELGGPFVKNATYMD